MLHEILGTEPYNEGESPELDALSAYLNYPTWSAIEASHFLAGVGLRDLSSIGPYEFLPGGRDKYVRTSPIDFSLVSLNLDLEVEICSRFCFGGPKRPADWLKAALEADYEPCWADALDKSPEEVCKAAFALICQYRQVSERPRRHEFELSAQNVGAVQAIAKSGGEAKSMNSRQTAALRLIVKEWDQTHPRDRRAFTNEMLRQYVLPEGGYPNTLQKAQLSDGSPRARRSSIERWVRHLAKEQQTGIPWQRALKIREKHYMP